MPLTLARYLGYQMGVANRNLAACPSRAFAFSNLGPVRTIPRV